MCPSGPGSLGHPRPYDGGWCLARHRAHSHACHRIVGGPARGHVAVRLHLPSIVGYLVAGILVGPFTPGLQATPRLAPQLAEIGVILLMFGVGNHFSIGQLLAVRSIALPGAIGQIMVAVGLGYLLAWWWGWSFGEGLVFGLALSVASTVVLLRALEERDALTSPDGQIAVGWLVVEDLVMVFALVLLPAFAEPLGGTPVHESEHTLGVSLTITAVKLAVFVALMLVIGVRVIPWLLRWIDGTGHENCSCWRPWRSRSASPTERPEFFDVSFALGASSPALWSMSPSSAIRQRRRHSPCGRHSPCCSSCRSGC